MTITKNANGSITISTIIKGYLTSRTYYGYSLLEAKQAFKLELLD